MSEQKQTESAPADDEKWKENFKRVTSNFVPYDPRFPNTNQTRNCQTNYLDYFRCLKSKDEDYCAWYKNAYERLCPNEWIEKWDEQRANGNFPNRDCL